MKEMFKEIFLGFKNSPLATLCVLLVGGFAFIYSDLRDINAEQRQFMNKLHDSQVLMNENLTALNLRMTHIEQNFTTTPQQLKELIMLLHSKEIGELENK